MTSENSLQNLVSFQTVLKQAQPVTAGKGAGRGEVSELAAGEATEDARTADGGTLLVVRRAGVAEGLEPRSMACKPNALDRNKMEQGHLSFNSNSWNSGQTFFANQGS